MDNDKQESILDMLEQIKPCKCDYKYIPNKSYDGKTDLRTHLMVCKICGSLGNYMDF